MNNNKISNDVRAVGISSIGSSICNSIENDAWYSIINAVYDPIWELVMNSLLNSEWVSVRSVGDSVKDYFTK